MRYGALILAAGKSRRMQMEFPKVLLPVCGIPAIKVLVQTVKKLGINPVIVIGYKGDEVKKVIGDECETVEQSEQLGNAHAVYIGMDKVRDYDKLFILYGDVPLIEVRTLKKMISAGGDCVILTKEIEDPRGYGRIIRENGRVLEIKEEKYLTPSQRKIKEVNLGVYLISYRLLEKYLPVIMRERKDGEYYLTDIVKLIVEDGGDVKALSPLYEWEGMGMNTPSEYALLLNTAYKVGREMALKRGCSILGEDVLISPFSKVEGVIIYNGVRIDGRCKIERGVIIEDGCIIKDTVIKRGTHIKPYSVIEGAVIGENCVIGPFARLREGTRLKRNVKIGNFVEIKKSSIGEGVKAQHLSYIGDAFVGRGTNIGAGTITCNYDGFKKQKTYIGENVFVGSDVQFVAPVKVGKCAWIGAGSTITKNVPPYALGITRAEQKNIKDYAKRKKRCAE